MRTLAISGFGLLGGSFALRIRDEGFGGRILAVSSDPARVYPAPVDATVTIEQAAAEADVILLCRPIHALLDDIKALGPLVRDETLVTDIGSTKRVIMRTAREHLKRGVFLGGHPMAGSQFSGFSNASRTIFEGKAWYLTTEAPDDPRVAGFERWIRRVGANPVPMSDIEHDRLLAAISHVPQILSSSLAASLSMSGIPAAEASARSGRSLGEMLRIAESDWDMWRGIFDTNGDFILEALTNFSAELKHFASGLDYRARAGSSGFDQVLDAFKRGGEYQRRFREAQDGQRRPVPG